MIKISKNIKDEYTNGKIQDLFTEVDNVLQKRETIQERYLRGITSTTPGSERRSSSFFRKIYYWLSSRLLIRRDYI